ncbi:DUF4129 domain-containing protein [Roseibium marinum]|uniref:Uncharacterized protein DUF4129 n=1 Tax=Roseibium marinum TaxID=281252 RepID=A0A2S3UY35_9HYPH|nr:DUF4129 domain-containing protein [Roseibium marinum]POF32638.1 uncharacterized protein DUF4129 [Roseibium marinum]
MRCFFVFFVLSIVFFPLTQSLAQDAVREPVEIGESGRDYLRSIRLRRIAADVAYYDPSAPAPELTTGLQPEPPRQPAADRPAGDINWPFLVVSGAVLAAILYLFLRLGGRMTVSLKRDARNPGSGRRKARPEAPAWAEKLGTLDEILRIDDRRRALVLLARKALAATVAANGILMQRSWTARDALRHIPDRQARLDALRSLVMASERVQFGGRNVSEDEFRQHVAGCRQLLGPGTP